MEFAGRCVTNWRSASVRANLGVIAGHPMQLVILVYMGLIGLIYMALSGFILRGLVSGITNVPLPQQKSALWR